MYTEAVMDHFFNPRNAGELADADGVGEAGNPVCGDIMRIYLKIEDDKIVDIKFKTFGCGAAIATSSILTELVKGKSIAEAEKITNRAVAEALGGFLPKDALLQPGGRCFPQSACRLPAEPEQKSAPAVG